MRVALPVVLVLLSALGAACGSRSGANPTPARTETSAPVGPMLAYLTASPVRTLHVYDAGARREWRSLQLGGGDTVKLRPGSDEVLYIARGEVADRSVLHAWSASTGVDRVLYTTHDATEWDMAVSADGAALAFTQIDASGVNSSVNVLTIATVEARTIATFVDPYAGAFRGVPVPRAWRDDGTGILVSGDTGSGAEGSWATVKLDGTVAGSMRGFGVPAPNGRWIADAGFGEAGCVFAVQRLEIWDIDAGRATASVEDPQRGIVLDGWSPDGESVMYRQYDPKNPPNDGDCVPDYDQSTERAYLLSVHGGEPTPVADVDALRRQWNRGHDVTFTCGEPPASPPGAAAPTPDVFGTCPFGGQVLTVDGAPVAKGVERVLGFIDAPGG